MVTSGANPSTSSDTSAKQRSDDKHGSPFRGVCTFWLGEQHFGLDVAIVSEVVIVPDVTAVPSSPRAVRGLFNLRGTAVPLVDLHAVLDLADTRDDRRSLKTVLVVKSDELLVGFPIDRVDSVVLAGRGTFTESSGREDPAVAGFLELADTQTEAESPSEATTGSARTVTVLASQVLLTRLEAARFVAPDA
jgi:chemotaxis signal transduction protein